MNVFRIMNASQSQGTLESMLAETGAALMEQTVERAFACMFRFYRDHRAADCLIGRDTDMLLFQWSGYSPPGEFHVDLTRQFVTGPDDEDIWQLSLTFSFDLSDDLVRLGSGNKWCREPRSRAVDYFEAFVQRSAAYRAVFDRQPLCVGLVYSCTG